MREILFRVWNGAEMVYDVTVGKFGVFYVNPTNNGLDPNDSASITPFTTKYHEGTPVMQYTGLQDKNGKEIYESDIVRPSSEHITSNCLVEWNNRSWCLKAHNWSNWFADHVWKEVEVIGNIHEHPELLKQ